MSRLRRFLGISIPALVAGMLFVPNAAAQQLDPEDVPSVGVLPVGTKTDDPNSGQWFIAALAPGESTRFTAAISNPAFTPQAVKLYLADLDFTASGAAEVAEQSDDVGTWGSVDRTRIEVPAQRTELVSFTIKAPATADPGDHLGVLVAEGDPAGNGNVRVIKRVATRIYITLPGDAVPGFNIEKVQLQRDSSFFTKEITTTVIVRNTGRVRISPTVMVNGTKAEGPELLMSRSVEQFVATTNVPIWGGPQNVRVDVGSKIARRDGADGPFRQARASVFVIPWVLMAGLAVLLALGLLARRLWRNRGGRYAAMAADMKRIERLLAEQRAGAEVGGHGNGNGRPETPEQAIKAAMKRAARAGDDRAKDRLRQKLEEHQRAAAPPPPAAPPAPPPAERPPVERPQAAPAPEVTIVGEASLRGHGNQPLAEADSLAVTLIRSALDRARASGDDAEVARLEAKLERERASR